MGKLGKGIVAILAAGKSERMGFPKQMARVGGRTLTRRACETALRADVGEVCLVTGACGDEVANETAGFPVEVLFNERWREGQATSVCVAARHAIRVGADFLVVIPVDMPHVPAAHLRALADQVGRRTAQGVSISIVASECRGVAMAPCAFAACEFDGLSRLQGDCGAARVVRDPDKRVCRALVPFENPSMAFDCDTAEDLRRAEGVLGHV